MFGLSVAAQRGCWKLFHDTATVHSVSPPPAGCVPAGAVPAGVWVAVPPPVQATSPRATMPRAAANLRNAMGELLRANRIVIPRWFCLRSRLPRCQSLLATLLSISPRDHDALASAARCRRDPSRAAG